MSSGWPTESSGLNIRTQPQNNRILCLWKFGAFSRMKNWFKLSVYFYHLNFKVNMNKIEGHFSVLFYFNIVYSSGQGFLMHFVWKIRLDNLSMHKLADSRGSSPEMYPTHWNDFKGLWLLWVSQSFCCLKQFALNL